MQNSNSLMTLIPTTPAPATPTPPKPSKAGRNQLWKDRDRRSPSECVVLGTFDKNGRADGDPVRVRILRVNSGRSTTVSVKRLYERFTYLRDLPIAKP
jgi:hypothetical protein